MKCMAGVPSEHRWNFDEVDRPGRSPRETKPAVGRRDAMGRQVFFHVGFGCLVGLVEIFSAAIAPTIKMAHRR